MHPLFDAPHETDSRTPTAPPAWDSPLPISPPPESMKSVGDSSPTQTEHALIYLQHLQPFHQLRRKWNLRCGVEIGLYQVQQTSSCAEEAPETTTVRLFGLLPNGEAWEAYIPMADILRHGGISLGRDSESSYRSIPDPSVSRVHAILELTENGLVLTDANSTNGTALNNLPLSPYAPQTPVHDGDTLSLGNVVLQVEFLHPPYTS